jgi:uncharacterized protein YndB with AHSA1/START domain
MSDEKPKRSISAEADLAFPIDLVWRAITDSECVALWFMKNDIKPETGLKFNLLSRPIERWDGDFSCQVLDVVPNRKISFAWRGGHEELKRFGHYIDTVATWTITPNEDGGTHFRFDHEGFGTEPEMDGCFEEMSKGAASICRTLNKMMPDFLEEFQAEDAKK